MSTIVLLLITGLGLGALYFLVASGLSLIYGLMGVLNFAHGSFLTLGAFVGWETARRIGARPWLRCSPRSLVGAASARWSPRDRAAADPAPLRAPHRAGAGHGRARAGQRRAFERHLGHRPELVTGPAGSARPPDARAPRSQRPVPADRGRACSCSWRPRLPALHPLRPDDPRRRREPLDGHRARHRRASCVHRGLRDRRRRRRARGVLASHYFGYVSPQLGASLLIFAFIVTVIGGLGSLRCGGRRGRRRGAAAVRQLLTSAGRATSSSCCCSPWCCLSARRPDGRSGMRTPLDPAAPPGARRPARWRRRRWFVALLPLLNIGVPGVLPGSTYTPGTLQLLALCLLFGGARADLHVVFGARRAAVVRSRAVLRGRRLRAGHRARRPTVPRLPAMMVLTLVGAVRRGGSAWSGCGSAGSPSRWSPWRSPRPARCSSAATPTYRRRGGPSPVTTQCRTALVGVTDTRNLYWLALGLVVVVFALVTWVERSRAGRVAGHPGERAARAGARPAAVRGSSCSRSSWPLARRARLAWSTCCCRAG